MDVEVPLPELDVVEAELCELVDERVD